MADVNKGHAEMVTATIRTVFAPADPADTVHESKMPEAKRVSGWRGGVLVRLHV